MANDTHTDSLRVGGYEIVSPPDAWQKLRETYEFIRNRVAVNRQDLWASRRQGH